LAIIVGSRAHLEKESIAKRSLFRTILMYGFHFLVWLFTVKTVKDTQCGFKLFTRDAARLCFDSIHVERWYLRKCVKKITLTIF
jgi:dolichyl-phosphate beta-glucosyltransferase